MTIYFCGFIKLIKFLSVTQSYEEPLKNSTNVVGSGLGTRTVVRVPLVVELGPRGDVVAMMGSEGGIEMEIQIEGIIIDTTEGIVIISIGVEEATDMTGVTGIGIEVRN